MMGMRCFEAPGRVAKKHDVSTWLPRFSDGFFDGWKWQLKKKMGKLPR